MSRKQHPQRNPRYAPVGHLTAQRTAPSRRVVLAGRRARLADAIFKTPFAASERWYEPRTAEAGGYRFIVQEPGEGYRHAVTPEEICQRLDEAPRELVRPLQVVQLSRLTRKKSLFPCYGMQWGGAVYLYPMPADLIEYVPRPPLPAERNEAAMFGGRWKQTAAGLWQLVWTEQAIKDYYLNNILFHELGHLHDRRNRRHADRERFAEWFAVRFGYQPSRRAGIRRAKPARRRHHAK